MGRKGQTKHGGRQKGTKNKQYVFLPDAFKSKNIDWITDLCRHLRRMPDYLRFKYYIELMPYLAARLESQPFKPSSPAESRQAVEDTMRRLKELENIGLNKPTGSNTSSLDNRPSDVQAQANPAENQGRLDSKQDKE